jgi:hypothetical protein
MGVIAKEYVSVMSDGTPSSCGRTPIYGELGQSSRAITSFGSIRSSSY